MKILIQIALLVLLVACSKEDVQKFKQNDKLKEDSEEVVRDLLDIEEDLVKDKTGIDLKKGKDNAPSKVPQ